jgi:hypothetical protein
VCRLTGKSRLGEWAERLGKLAQDVCDVHDGHVIAIAIGTFVCSTLCSPQRTRSERLWLGFGVAFVITLIVFSIYMTTAINTYGA